ncbi:MAG: radical SAM protein [Candidatus Bathyarchaeota archaeon]|nr:MAG: radical SAM protein [Candidatus Bathyarchaeota archaeon]
MVENTYSSCEPSYIKMHKSSELEERIEKLYQILESCELCPRKCRVNRRREEKGTCRSGKELQISSYGPHFGEEPPLVGKTQISVMDLFGASKGGSGTIFLTHCSLLCVYCQNYDISHLGYGKTITPNETARIMIELQNRGCHNINFVTPTHFTPQLIKATKRAITNGLKIPIVWNCSGYENVEIIKLLDGIVDIYMPDIKYSQSDPAKKYSKAPDYFDRCKEAVKEMFRQVGDLRLDKKGIAYRGLLIRHLVLPNDLSGSMDVLKFIADDLSTNSYVNIMPQYRPEGDAYRFKELSRKPTWKEVNRVKEIAKKLGLTRGI